MSAPVGRAAVVELMAHRLWQKLEHLDPGDGPWEELDEGTRVLWCRAMEFALTSAGQSTVDLFYSRTPATTK